jgi:hypothetical protein
MNRTEDPAQVYHQQAATASLTLQCLLKKRKLLGWLRLICIVIPLVLSFLFLPQQVMATVISWLLGIGCFLTLVSLDTANNAQIGFQERLVAINEREIAILQHQYTSFEDGKTFEPATHAYAADLDLLGPYSLYQYLNRCTSEQGKQLLAERLLHPLPSQDIPVYQEAVQELAPRLEWRQTLQNHGQSAQLTLQTEQRVLQWLQQPQHFFRSGVWRYMVMVYPVIPFGCVVLALLEKINLTQLSAILFLLYGCANLFARKISTLHSYVSRIEPEIHTLASQLQHIESPNWKAAGLQKIRALLRQDGQLASAQAYRLQRILNRLDYRLNLMVNLALNTFLFWDIRQAIALLQWKQQHQMQVTQWFRALAETEYISTLATLQFNHPGWCFPGIAGTYFSLHATEMGHPLIPPGKRVNNDCSISGQGQVMLITGSNMAGKSTFLRSLGINAVLAMMGAPVCARQMVITPVQLLSSMRIADNLAESTSTFYAELKKLQFIISKVNRHEPVLILLDEILRGTNSLDRHTGSAALIRQIIREQSIAVVATHDVELARMQHDFPGTIHNFHFDVQVNGEELYFDYRLKSGVCQSMNASLLMKKIGIQI